MLRDIDTILEQIQSQYSTVSVQQLRVKHPGIDDDGLWFLQQPDCRFEVQIESSSGNCPFLIETDEHEERVTALSISEAIGILGQWLHLSVSAV